MASNYSRRSLRALERSVLGEEFIARRDRERAEQRRLRRQRLGWNSRSGALGVGTLLGAVVMVAVPAIAANMHSGTFNMNAGSSLRVTCPNTLTNSNMQSNGETVVCADNAVNTTTTAGNPTTTTTTRPTTTTTTVKPTTTTTRPVSTTTTTAPLNDHSYPLANYQCISWPASNQNLPLPGTYDVWSGWPRDSSIYNSNGYNTYVGNNVWGPETIKSSQTCARSPHDWYVTVNAPNGTGAIQGYPDFKQGMDDVALSQFTSLPSSWNVTMPAQGTGDWWSTFDIWLGNTTHDEIMIPIHASDERGTGGSTVINPDVVIGGQHFKYMAYECDSSNPCFTPQIQLLGNQDVGQIDILAVLKFLQTQKDNAGQPVVSANATIGEVGFGFEYADTNGVPLTFRVNGFTLNAG
jgi:hypothetical protein